MTDTASVVYFDAKDHAHITPYLAAIHASCITHDRTIATFLPPLSHEKLLGWWKERIAEVSDDSRVILLLVNELEASGRVKGPEIMGVAMLHMPQSETGPFRGTVEKLLVHKSFRGRGGARLLINALEEEAVKRQRTLLVRRLDQFLKTLLTDLEWQLLDTETGSPAEAVYSRLGYTEMGRIPNYGISPTGELKDGTFFYKDLSERTYQE